MSHTLVVDAEGPDLVISYHDMKALCNDAAFQDQLQQLAMCLVYYAQFITTKDDIIQSVKEYATAINLTLPRGTLTDILAEQFGGRRRRRRRRKCRQTRKQCGGTIYRLMLLLILIHVSFAFLQTSFRHQSVGVFRTINRLHLIGQRTESIENEGLNFRAKIKFQSDRFVDAVRTTPFHKQAFSFYKDHAIPVMKGMANAEAFDPFTIMSFLDRFMATIPFILNTIQKKEFAIGYKLTKLVVVGTLEKKLSPVAITEITINIIELIMLIRSSNEYVVAALTRVKGGVDRYKIYTSLEYMFKILHKYQGGGGERGRTKTKKVIENKSKRCRSSNTVKTKGGKRK